MSWQELQGSQVRDGPVGRCPDGIDIERIDGAGQSAEGEVAQDRAGQASGIDLEHLIGAKELIETGAKMPPAFHHYGPVPTGIEPEMFEIHGIGTLLAVAGDDHGQPSNPKGSGRTKFHLPPGYKAAPPDHATVTDGQDVCRSRERFSKSIAPSAQELSADLGPDPSRDSVFRKIGVDEKAIEHGYRRRPL